MKRTFALVIGALFIIGGVLMLGFTHEAESYSSNNGNLILKGTIKSFDVSGSDPDIIYAVTGSDGTLKSVNAGKSWKKVTSLKSITKIEIDANDPDIVYATQGG
ncbi:WD40/YVTN/BNR-like repeat-containing protein [candidate division KSB1 bacterium]